MAESIDLLEFLKDPKSDYNKIVGKNLEIPPFNCLCVEALSVVNGLAIIKIEDCPFVDTITLNLVNNSHQMTKGISTSWKKEPIFVT